MAEEQKKSRGRKASVETIEARKYVNEGHLENLLKASEVNLSEAGTTRLLKAVKFGLGIVG